MVGIHQQIFRMALNPCALQAAFCGSFLGANPFALKADLARMNYPHHVEFHCHRAGSYSPQYITKFPGDPIYKPLDRLRSPHRTPGKLSPVYPNVFL